MMRSQIPLGRHRSLALIPARAGSKRCPGKNVRLLGGKPLLVYSIDVAKESMLFSEIIVSTDDPEAAAIAKAAGVTVHARKPEHATDDAPDYTWVSDVLQDRTEDLFAILRPTSPFRSASMLRRAYALLIGSEAHSIRAVQKVKEHPGKMWESAGRYIVPVLNRKQRGTPWHSSPTQCLPVCYRQTASLEMGWIWMVSHTHTISGTQIAPFLVDDLEGFDINEEADMAEAHRLVGLGMSGRVAD